ncbi:MAG: arginine--tRNA ligase [Omnitrophica bacterium]|nr:arginine--tRNA ligase [Candidatus Omnitrophota bacterium]
MKTFYNKISSALEEVVKKKYGISLNYPLWELPPKQEFGDLSSMVALKLGSKLKEDPLDIAAQIKKSLEKTLSGYIERIEILRPGFINIFISKEALIDSLNKILKIKGDFFRTRIKKKVLLEFLSANPTGPLSVAHGRQAVIGDVIANILEFFSNNVTREYYINDSGKQIDLLAASVLSAVSSLMKPKREIEAPKNGYKGEYIKDIAEAVLMNRDWQKNPEDFNLKGFSLGYILALIRKDLNSLGIEFDNWVSQRDLIEEKKVDEAIEILRKRTFVYEKEDALWFAATRFGDDKDRVLRKADGELTYFASDIAYHKDKLERKHNELINLWGPDHHGYIKRVESAIAGLKYKKDILKIVIIQLVSLKTKEKMSRRAGTAVLLCDLINSVGKDTTRFYYLTRRNSSHLEFDIDLAKEVSFNNPLYYIQYACARIESIFKKAKVSSFHSEFSKFLTDDEDIALLRTLLQFSHCLDKAYYSLEPIFIIEFLKNLASSFHKFYEKKRVLEEDKNIKKARLNLLLGVREVLHCALKLLGIAPVEKM